MKEREETKSDDGVIGGSFDLEVDYELREALH